MGRLVFEVSGSAAYPYEVCFAREQGDIKASCTCPAGKFNAYCKHRFAIMAGDDSSVVSQNKEQVAIVKSWLIESALGETFTEYLEAERDYSESGKRLSKAKKKLVRMMSR